MVKSSLMASSAVASSHRAGISQVIGNAQAQREQGSVEGEPPGIDRMFWNPEGNNNEIFHLETLPPIV